MTINFTYRNPEKKEILYSTNAIDPVELILDFQSFLVAIGYAKEKIDMIKNYEELYLDKACAERGCPAIDRFAEPEEIEVVYRKIK
jgi:hypothetical protein